MRGDGEGKKEEVKERRREEVLKVFVLLWFD